MEILDEMEVSAKHAVAGMKISVIGAARSGLAVARLLLSHGANVFVSDSSSRDKLRNQMPDLESLGVAFEVGSHSARVLDADLVVLSPGVPSTADIVRDIKNRGIRIVSELEAASWYCPSPIIAITGTNGKTTTTTLAGRLLEDARKNPVVAGNIGNAFSSVIPELTPSSIAVLEVSSFQLDDIESFHPKVSVILNITPDHLDRYEHSFEKYIASKCRIFENQTADDYLIYSYDDEETRECARRLASLHVHAIPFSATERFEEGASIEDGKLVTSLAGKRTEIVAVNEITIRGVHNLYNSMAAVLAAQLMGVTPGSARATLRNFKGVEHRLEYVREIGGVKYVNDSKATNVDSVWYALQSFREPIVLLLGGRDKGNDYTKLYDLVERKVKAIVAIGESAGTVEREFSKIRNVVTARSMPEAVASAASLATSGDVVLLSPACASFDWFENYEHRGRVFKQLVNDLGNVHNAT